VQDLKSPQHFEELLNPKYADFMTFKALQIKHPTMHHHIPEELKLLAT
jgi:hypothetical protein